MQKVKGYKTKNGKKVGSYSRSGNTAWFKTTCMVGCFIGAMHFGTGALVSGTGYLPAFIFTALLVIIGWEK